MIIGSVDIFGSVVLPKAKDIFQLERERVVAESIGLAMSGYARP